MSDLAQERFDLGKFVLGYLEEAGSVVMPPEFDSYEVLMPDEVAHKLALDPYAHLTFATSPPTGPTADAMRLSVNHPLVERIAQTMVDQPANAHSYIRGVRTDKRGLAALARTHFSLPNARIDALPTGQEEAMQHQYLLCNFKVTLVSEEKQEELVAVVMDLQAGHAVDDETILERLAIIDPEPVYQGLPIAPPRWQGTGEALAPATLQALLPRAEAALRQKLAAQVATLATRMERHLSLDLARIGDYYDEMRTDLQRRQERLSEDDSERRQGFDEKLAMLAAERDAKLADARSRYALRVEMQLLNVLLVTQAKVVLPMSISNRTATITRTIVWDPLTHRLEPLVCDVCGKPGEGLHLCTGGHLVHEGCLAPQCIDCKREFCQHCARQISECVVCHRPVCRPSLIKCATCGRGTCHEHQQLCHAADGQPETLPDPSTATAKERPEPVAPVTKATASTGPKPTPKSTKTAAAPSVKGTALKGTKATAVPPPTREPVVKGARIDIQIEENKPIIVAFVMRSTNRVLATRSFELTDEGIVVHCNCEKSPCPAHGYVYRPAAAEAITEQIERKLRELQQEYLVPAKKIKYYYQRLGEVREEKRFALPALWRNATRLAEALQGFDKLGQ